MNGFEAKYSYLLPRVHVVKNWTAGGKEARLKFQSLFEMMPPILRHQHLQLVIQE